MHDIAHFPSNAINIAGQTQHHVGVRPATPIGKPGRVGEVVQRDERFDAGLPEAFELAAIHVQCALIELTRRWLDARPLDRQAVGV